jgi:hypothetical protein
MSGNRNSRYRVACRIINQVLRRTFFRLDTPMRRRLWAERRWLTDREHLLEEHRVRLARLNWALGQGSVYHLPPEVVAWSRRTVAQILAELLAEGRIDPPSPQAALERKLSCHLFDGPDCPFREEFTEEERALVGEVEGEL